MNSNDNFYKKILKKIKLLKKRSVSSIVVVILLIVISVSLVILMLSFLKEDTIEGLDKADKILKEDNDLKGYIYTSDPKPDHFILKNLSKKPVDFTHYQILSDGNSDIYGKTLPVPDNFTTIESGGQTTLPIPCSPGSNYSVNLITQDGSYVTVPVNSSNNSYENSCDCEDLPHLVCLGAQENGSGNTAEDPIIICSVEDLNNVRNNLDKHYKLGSNIDMNVSPYNEGEGWDPIGNSHSNIFTGSFDGDNYIISNLYINIQEDAIPPNNNDYKGLFGYISDANLINLKLEGVDVNVFMSGYIGTLVGSVRNSVINNCNSNGIISGTYSVGGLIGEAWGSSTITNSYFEGSVIGDYQNAGGLMGTQSGTTIVNYCYSTGSVVGVDFVGGLVGYLNGVSDTPIINNSYSNSNVSGNLEIGGLVGNNASYIYNSYSTGFVSGNGSDIGGLVGKNTTTSNIVNSYWDTETSGQTTSAGGTGKTTAEMKTLITFNNWNFDDIWNINDSITYPYLRNNIADPLPE